ncbi:PorP/SprF family type IX secretion system membrane protein [Flavobacterium terrae]|uniref:Type IX secretion system membrane protein, PorP/SprF family n=1 Tax=Flavobacterium terrae TaxID=415425 RepID=A0A1M6AVS7_9FLAO|nr:PorP/SprF family type IX secretion system membrane protein [Flavobacterium terrae]SHI40576.1 type IX secretion system membrane protein, PorP/SprF family [Flavobacterium terrae]
MRKGLLCFVLMLCLFETALAQTGDGVMSFDVPAKNSLKFNKFLINPTFSFVREDESFITFLNKRQWTGFQDAPTAYFFSYSGKFREQNGIAVGAFQRNFGILTSFGAVVNFARSIEISNESNFTMGLNLAYVNSGLNTGKVKVNETTDLSLQSVPKNSLVTINPGINYSTGFIDLGLSANNIFTYNFNNSEVVPDDPMRGVAAHLMYTGYMYNSGLFENGKFSALIKGEMGKEKTIFSGSILVNAPKAGWFQAGYNSLYGVSGGLGLIIAKKISLGYVVEKSLGSYSDFGLSHEITLAYKIRGYGDYEDAKPIVKATNKTNPYKRPVAVKRKSPAELKKERDAQLALKAQQEKERLEAERLRREKELAEAKAKAEEAARIKAEQEKALAEARAKAEAEARLKAEKDKENAVSEAERLRREKEAAALQAKLDAEAKAKEAAERLKAEQERARLEAERLRKERADAEAKAKADAAAQAKAEADRIAREKAEAARIAKEKADAEARAKAEEAARLKAEQDRLAKEQADAAAKAKAESDARAKAEAERIANEKAEAARIAKEQADAATRAKAEADRIAKEKADAEAKAKAEEAARLKAEQDRLAKEQADAAARAKAEADARAKAEAERIANEKAEAARLAKEQADAAARAKAEADRIAKEKADAEAKAKAEEAARLKAEQAEAAAKAKAETEARDKAEAERIANEKAEAARLAKEQAEAAAKTKAEADARAKAEAERIANEKAEAARLAKEQAEAAARAKAEADRIAKEKADAEARAKAEEAARLKAEQERLAKEQADSQARAKAEADARAKAEQERLAKEKANAEAKARAEEEERLRKEAEAKARLEAAKTAEDKELDNLTQVIDDSKKYQTESLNKFESMVNEKARELSELRKENDLSEQGIATQQKEVEFQSGAAANRALEALKAEINENSKNQASRIKEFETLAAERLKKVPGKNDLLNQSYARTLEQLKAEKLASDKQNAQLLLRLDQIKNEIEVEKKRRIKRATFDSNQTKYVKDRATLKQIKETTSPTGLTYTPADFDYGDEDQANMQIVKNIDNVDGGFYLVVAAHKDEAKRDAFIKKAIQAGQTNIDFFYNVATGTYYIYHQKFSDIQDATSALENKGNKAVNAKMVIVKIEK